MPFHQVEHNFGHVDKQEWTIISTEITTRKNETKGLTRQASMSSSVLLDVRKPIRK